MHIHRRFNGAERGGSTWTLPLEPGHQRTQAAAMSHRPMPPGPVPTPTSASPSYESCRNWCLNEGAREETILAFVSSPVLQLGALGSFSHSPVFLLFYLVPLSAVRLSSSPQSPLFLAKSQLFLIHPPQTGLYNKQAGNWKAEVNENDEHSVQLPKVC